MFLIYPILIAGSIAGGALYAVLSPFDLIKTQLQMRNELVKETNRWRLAYRKLYFSEVLDILRDMARREHFRTLRVGILPMYFLGTFTTGMRIATYQYAYNSRFLSTEKQDVLQPRSILFCGVVGSVSQLMMNPFAMMKTKLQYWALCQANLTKKKLNEINFLDVGRILHDKFGWKIFTFGWGCCIYRGFMANVVQMVIYNLILFEVDFCERRFFHLTQQEREKAMIISAMAAGTVSTLFVSPFDVVLTRMHTQPFMLNMRGLYYSNFRDACYKLIKYEGYYALYKGMFFLWARHGVIAACSMLFWDVWKDRVWVSIQKTNGPAFLQQDFVEYCFVCMDLF